MRGGGEPRTPTHPHTHTPSSAAFSLGVRAFLQEVHEDKVVEGPAKGGAHEGPEDVYPEAILFVFVRRCECCRLRRGVGASNSNDGECGGRVGGEAQPWGAQEPGKGGRSHPWARDGDLAPACQCCNNAGTQVSGRVPAGLHMGPRNSLNRQEKIKTVGSE